MAPINERWRKRKKSGPRLAATFESTDGPRQRARAALQANLGATQRPTADIIELARQYGRYGYRKT
jgi:hypothetical protein